MWIISDFFMRCYRIVLLDNQLLNTVLKSLIRIFVEMHLEGVSCILQLPFEAGCLLLFLFSVIFFAPLHKNRAHRLSIHSNAVLLIQL